MSDYLHLFLEILPLMLPVVGLSVLLGMVLAWLFRPKNKPQPSYFPRPTSAPPESPPLVEVSATELSEMQITSSDLYLKLNSEFKATNAQLRRLQKEYDDGKARVTEAENAVIPLRAEVSACNAQILMLLDKQRLSNEAAAKAAERIKTLEAELALAGEKIAASTLTSSHSGSSQQPDSISELEINPFNRPAVVTEDLADSSTRLIRI